MAEKPRKIVVHNQEFIWRYEQYIRYMPHHTSKLVFYRKEDYSNIQIYFFTEDTWTGGNPLNEGLTFIKDGDKQITLNLNRPKFAAEILGYVLNHYTTNQLKNLTINEGNDLLLTLGYRENYEEYNGHNFRYLKKP